jgi:hypothetical protein
VEKELALRLAAKAARGELVQVEPPPDSGVRPSSHGPATNVGGPSEDVDGSAKQVRDERPLSFAVYSVADLNARSHARRSMVALPEYAPPAVGVRDVVRAFVQIPMALWGALHAKRPRPRIRQAMEAPVSAFAAALRSYLKHFLKNVPWRKVGLGFGGVLGTLLLLTVFVLTAADLTDDVKPSSGSSMTASVKPPAVLAKQPASAETIELDDVAASPSPQAQVKQKPRAADVRPSGKVSGKKPTEVFNP